MTNEELKEYIDYKFKNIFIWLEKHYTSPVMNDIRIKIASENSSSILYKIEFMEKMLNDLWDKYFGEKKENKDNEN